MLIDAKWKNHKGIYKLSICHHVYIGSSINLYARLNRHFRDLKNNRHDNNYVQRCVNKYGLSNLTYEIIEQNDSWTKLELLEKEKYYINYFHADLNLKLDPITQQNCKTTSREVYQFDLFGNLIRKWKSLSEAARYFNVDVSNIVVCCKNPKRQKTSSGFLWSYKKSYKFPIEIIFVYDKHGKLIGKYSSTIDVYENYFTKYKRKTVLSSLRKHFNKEIPYHDYYFNTTGIEINKEVIEYNLKLQYYQNIFDNNPLVYHYNRSNELIEVKRLNEYKNNKFVRSKIMQNSRCYSLGKCNSKQNYNAIKIRCINLNNNIETIWNSIKEFTSNVFKNSSGYDRKIRKRLKNSSEIIFLNYKIKRVL